MAAKGTPSPEVAHAQAAAPPVPQHMAEPEESVEKRPEEFPKKAEVPKHVSEKAKGGRQKKGGKKAAINAHQEGKQAAAVLPNSKPSGNPVERDTLPAPLGGADTPRPPYPELALKRGQEGLVHIRCQVNAEGRVTNVSIAKSSGFKLLDEAALKTVGNWKFRAARKDGASVSGTVVVPVQFKLR